MLLKEYIIIINERNFENNNIACMIDKVETWEKCYFNNFYDF